jgi:twitching motility protein PilI
MTELADEPFAVLNQIAALSIAAAQGLPEQEETPPRWSGVGFELGGQRYVSPIGEVAEMLVKPEVTRVPGVKPWVLGVANVRGRLLTLLDLEAYFELPAGNQKKQRVLAMDVGEFYCGVLVSDVLGMQHFALDSYSETAVAAQSQMQTYTQGVYEQDGQSWTVFSLFELASDPNFFNVAL